MNGAIITHKKKHLITSSTDHDVTGASAYQLYRVNSGATALESFSFVGPSAFMINGSISRSVSSNNLTVALKTLAGTDASTSDPIHVRISGAVYTITAALSVTLNAGTNYFSAGSAQFATYEQDYFVYLGVNSGSVFIGIAAVPYGNLYSDFSGTSTNPLYFAASTTPSATDPVVNIGRFNATLSASTSFNWSVPNPSIIIQQSVYESRMLTATTGVAGFSALTTDAYSYKIIGDMLFSFIRIIGTSNDTVFNWQLRFVNVGVTSVGGGFGRDNGTAMPVQNVVASAASQVDVHRSTVSGSNVVTTTTWTNSGDKRDTGSIVTPIR